MKKYTDTQLREKMETAIDEMLKLTQDKSEGAGARTNAANVLVGLIRTYKEQFNVAPEEGQGGVRKFKNF